MINNEFSANSIRLARVTYVHPEGQKMEVIFLDTGDYGRDVQVMSPYAGTDFGFTSGIPSPAVEGHDENMTNDQDQRHITAVVANIQGIHVALGFLYPQVTEMAFTKSSDPDRMIERNPSDFYRTVSSAADMDMVHPGGAFFRIGAGDTPDDLAGRDFDGRWRIKHNKKDATITLSTKGAEVQLLPSGVITIKADKNVIVEAGEEISLTAGKKVTITAPVLETFTPVFETHGIHHDSNGFHS